MTARAVTDEQLGRLTRRALDFIRRVREGSIPFDVAMGLLQRAIEVRPRTDGGEANTPDGVLLTQELLDVPVIIHGGVHRRHPNGGGLVAETAEVADTAYVGFFARVTGFATVSNEARILDHAMVGDHAEVGGKAKISGNAHVLECAKIHDNARVRGSALIHGTGVLSSGSVVEGTAHFDVQGLNVGVYANGT